MPTALVHTCVRVRDVDASLRFYEALGFEERGRLNFASAYNVYVGLPGDDDRLELTVNVGRQEKEVEVVAPSAARNLAILPSWRSRFATTSVLARSKDCWWPRFARGRPVVASADERSRQIHRGGSP
jgi:catechol 2,3-dioxygenase-like lactoylglutathione lyase family enzyme